MRYPCLILKSMCKTEIHVEIEQEGRNVYGEPLEPVIWDGLCNYQDSGKTVLTAEKVLIQLEGCALIPGDIAPELPVITKGDIKVCLLYTSIMSIEASVDELYGDTKDDEWKQEEIARLKACLLYTSRCV